MMQKNNEILNEKNIIKESILYLKSSILYIIVATCAVGVMVFGVYLQTPKRYISSTSLFVPYAEYLRVEDKSINLNEIKYGYIFTKETVEKCEKLRYKNDKKIAISELIETQVSKEGAVLSMKMNEQNPEKAENCLRNVVDDIIKARDGKIKEKIDEKIKTINEVYKRIMELEIKYKFFNKRVLDIQTKESLMPAVFAEEVSKELTRLRIMKIEYDEYIKKLNGNKILIIEEIRTEPIAWKLTLTMAVQLVLSLGIIIGVGIRYFINNYNKILIFREI